MYYNTLSHTLDEEKFNRKKMEIADEMPNMINSKEHIMTVMNLPEQEHFSACRKAFESEMLLILGTANMLVNYKNKFPLQKKIKVIEKILGIFEEIVRTPFEGTGKPEPLKHELTGYWSRRRRRPIATRAQKSEQSTFCWPYYRKQIALQCVC